MKKFSIALFIIALFYGKFSFAMDLGFPISCAYGEDCLIESYFDHDARDGEFSDHTCGKLSSDKQSSTNFILMNSEQMLQGVNVLAGDSGVVTQLRDGMDDINVDMVGKEAIRGRECGNGIVIKHQRGYETQYCHLKKGSVVVKKNEKIEKGQMIGQVGSSGLASFPYLEFTVKINGKPVDPFTGEDSTTGEATVACDNPDIYPLWDKHTEKKLKYISTFLLGMGFSDKVPHAQGAREGKFSKNKIMYDSKRLALWADVFGALKDDELKLTILGPDGSILSSESRKFTSSNRRVFQFLGKKTDAAVLPLGDYVGKIELLRKDNEEIERVISSTTTVEIVDAQATTKVLKNDKE
jgi:hypothetical protein